MTENRFIVSLSFLLCASVSLWFNGFKFRHPASLFVRYRFHRKLHRADQIRCLIETLDLLFDAFGQIRFSTEWPKELAKMQKWLQREERRAAG